VEEVKKYVEVAYFLGFALFAWISTKVVESILGLSWLERVPNPDLLFGIPASTFLGVVIGGALIGYLRFANKKSYRLVTESAEELSKTNWPTWIETRANTLVVIAVTFILGFILWFFDLIWRTGTDLLYR
jgi:preprotein translocase SecE subunit